MTPEARDFRARMRESAPHFPSAPSGAAAPASTHANLAGACESEGASLGRAGVCGGGNDAVVDRTTPAAVRLGASGRITGERLAAGSTPARQPDRFNPLEEGRVWEPGELPVARVERRLFWRRLAIGAALALLVAGAGFTFFMAMLGGV